MTWNWQYDKWPEFTWEADKLQRAEGLFIEGAGLMIGSSRHLSDNDFQIMKVELLSEEALDTSAIEGEYLDRDSVQSSIRFQLGLSPHKKRAAPAEIGISEMMVDVYQSITQPLDQEVLFAWHRMVTNGRQDLNDVGIYRTHPEPMQIVSGHDYGPKIHFEAPPSHRVEAEMSSFLKWYEKTAPGGKSPLPAVVRAGLAHIWFESIHPFEDGNGRIGRAISEKSLSQGFSSPIITAIAVTLFKRRKEYYAALEQASRSLDITQWLLFFASTVIESQRRSQAFVDFFIEKARYMEEFSSRFNQRQQKAILRIFREGPEGFKGGLSAGNYITITGVSQATARRDLQDLVEKKALRRTGEKRWARYYLPFAAVEVETVKVKDIL